MNRQAKSITLFMVLFTLVMGSLGCQSISFAADNGACIIRGKAARESETWEPPIPTHVGHPIRVMRATF